MRSPEAATANSQQLGCRGGIGLAVVVPLCQAAENRRFSMNVSSDS